MLKKPYLRGFTIGNDLEEAYLNDISAIRHLHAFTFSQPVTFFVGENGSGKSTLLEALAVLCGFNPEGGTRSFRFATVETHSKLHESMKIIRNPGFPSEGFFLRAESFYNVATEIDRLASEVPGGEGFMARNYGGKSLHAQSHGESFIALALNRFKGNSLFFLDEPEAALSPTRQMTLLARMHELVKENCQFIIATHSPILMAYPHAEIVMLTEQGACITPYTETEHYQITRQFLTHTDSMLKALLNEDSEPQE